MCNKNRAKEYYKNNRDVILNRSKEKTIEKNIIKNITLKKS